MRDEEPRRAKRPEARHSKRADSEEDEPQRFPTKRKPSRTLLFVSVFLFLALVAGGIACFVALSGKGKKLSTTNLSSSETAPEIVDNIPAIFDERDPSRTFRWVIAEIQPARSAKNAIHRKQEQERLEKSLKTVRGKKVDWVLAISHIHSSGIELTPLGHPSNYTVVLRQREDAARLEKRPFNPDRDMADMHPTYTMAFSFTKGGSGYPLSPSPWANSLQTGDRVRVAGTIQNLTCEQNLHARFEAYSIALHFDNDAVVGPVK